MSETGRCKWEHPEIILVATDLSDLARTMPIAIEEAAATGARMVVLHVIAVSEAVNADVSGNPIYDPLGAAEITEQQLAPWVELAGQRGVNCQTLIKEGNPADKVLEAAKNLHVNRIVVGTRARGKISKLLIGSVAEHVVRFTHVPVVTVGPEAHWRSEDTERVVLHATQLLPNAKAHAELAECVTQTLAARLVLLHVMNPNQTAVQEAAARETLKKLAEEITHVPVEIHLVHGYAPEQILAVEKEMKANLIVLGSTPRSSLAEITRDRTVYRVLAHAHCPVMTLHTTQSRA